MAYLTGLAREWSSHRSASAAIAADSSTLTDANIDPTVAIDVTGLETIWVAPDITGGASPTMTFEVLSRDANASDGQRWRRQRNASGLVASPVLAVGEMAELSVPPCGKVFIRITAVTNAGGTTAWKILVLPGKRTNGPNARP